MNKQYPYFERLAEIDRILSLKPPEKKLSVILKKLLLEKSSKAYFYDNIDSETWLQALSGIGQFGEPQDPIIEGEKTSYPFWPQSNCLVRLADKFPELVYQIIADMPKTDNILIINDLLSAASKLPPKFASNLIPKFSSLIESKNKIIWIDYKALGDLFTLLVKNDLWKNAKNFANSFLNVRPDKKGKVVADGLTFNPEPDIKIENYHYETFLKDYYLKSYSKIGLDGLKYLCNILTKAINYSFDEPKKYMPYDNSYIWRINIEGGEEDYDYNVKDYLVSAIRDLGQLLLEDKIITDSDLIPYLNELGKSWEVFNRLALYFISKNQSMIDNSYIVSHLLNENLFESEGVRKEYNVLLQKYFSTLEIPEREIILSWADKDINNRLVKDWLLRLHGKEPEKEKIEDYQNRQKLTRMTPIKDNLWGDWEKKYTKWESKFGKVESTDIFTLGPTKFGWDSPKLIKPIDEMDVEEIYDFLRNWRPKNEWDTQSPRGLASKLLIQVRTNPNMYSKKLEGAKSLDVTYVHQIIIGFEEAIRNKNEFEILPVLQFCKWISKQPIDIDDRKLKHHDLDPNWTWTRNSIAKLIEALLKSDRKIIKLNHSNELWTVIKLLTNDKELTPEYERKYLNDRPATLALNTTLGSAMSLIIDYCKWCNENHEGNLNFNDLPEQRDILENHLDTKFEKSLAVRSVYGRRLVELIAFDENWVRKNREKIFPKERRLKKYNKTAWETYVSFNRGYENVFDLLREQYEAAIDGLKYNKGNHKGEFDPYKAVVQHIFNFYWSGKLEKSNSMLLIDKFFENASTDLKGYALEWLGRGIYDAHEKPEEIYLKRLYGLWELTFSKPKKRTVLKYRRKVLNNFGWWFSAKHLKASWRLEQLEIVLNLTGGLCEPDHIVLDQLVELSIEYPVESIRCLYKLVDGYSSEVSLRGWLPEAQIILENASKSSNKRAMFEAMNTADLLGKSGFLQFRDLYYALSSAAHD